MSIVIGFIGKSYFKMSIVIGFIGISYFYIYIERMIMQGCVNRY